MSEPATGDRAPDFCLPATGDQQVCLDDLRGRWLVLYFYPKDSTPGCTKEGQAFRDLHGEFDKAGATVLGVSRDGVKAHENFKTKTMYGKKVRGIERSTFLIDPEGTVRAVWRKVKVDGHADAVLQTLRENA